MRLPQSRYPGPVYWGWEPVGRMDLKQTLGYTSKGPAFQAFDVPALAVGPGRRPWEGIRIP